jgi:hypothetical protein
MAEILLWERPLSFLSSTLPTTSRPLAKGLALVIAKKIAAT